MDVARLLDLRSGPVTSTWTQDDVIRYHLAIGAGAASTDTRYIYELAPLEVLPTFSSIVASPAAAALIARPEWAFEDVDLIQTAHELDVHHPLSPSGELRSTATVSSIHDTGRSAVVVIRVESTDPTDRIVAVNRLTVRARGRGGFGGTAPPDDLVGTADGRDSGTVIESTVPSGSAALFRLMSDRTPMHIDPEYARSLGFADTPLQGLCTMGLVARLLVDAVLDGQVVHLTGLSIRFVSPVYPGDRLRVAACADGRGTVFDVSREGGSGVDTVLAVGRLADRRL